MNDDAEEITRIEWSIGLVLQRRDGEWRFTDPPWFTKSVADGGRTWLALTPFTKLEDALLAAKKVLPAYKRAHYALLNLNRARQSCYRIAMKATL